MQSKAAARLAEALTPRTELGMTAAELARTLGVTQQAVSQWLKGENIPRADMMRRLEDLTGVPMRDWTEPADSSASEPAA
jgi:transcriptional regulator with XRE-family HTH domain